jgi:hypothetical protein
MLILHDLCEPFFCARGGPFLGSSPWRTKAAIFGRRIAVFFSLYRLVTRGSVWRKRSTGFFVVRWKRVQAGLRLDEPAVNRLLLGNGLLRLDQQCAVRGGQCHRYPRAAHNLQKPAHDGEQLRRSQEPCLRDALFLKCSRRVETLGLGLILAALI